MRRAVLLAASLTVTLLAFSRETATLASHSFAASPSGSLSSPRPANTSWNPQFAAAYLDQRASWWMAWPRAQRDHETFCISCHTAVPYAMSRATLRAPLSETALSPNERRLLDNVARRVRLWREVAPFYSDKDRGAYKTVESRGTESVLNALVLVSNDAPTGRLSPDALTALSNMWAEQVTAGTPISTSASFSSATAAPAKSNYDSPTQNASPAYSDHPNQLGAWRWLRFKNEPWEADDSDFYGAALAAVAVGAAPENYRARPEIQRNLQLLRLYLNRQAASEPLMNRIVLLWASAKLPGLLTREQQKAALEELFALQQPDGGWSLSSLAGNWQRHDNTPQDQQSDGYATGLIAFAAQQMLSAASPALPSDSFARESNLATRLDLARRWLATHQDPTTGAWPSASLNNNTAHHLSPETALFMNDAATSYALLALSTTNAPH